jgi:hypothetical protein
MKPSSLVAVAGLLSLLAFSPAAEAKVVYTPVNVTVSGNGYITLDLNHDGKTDFTILVAGRVLFCAGTGRGTFGEVAATPTAGNGILGAYYAGALGYGYEIDSRQSFLRDEALMTEYSTCLWPPNPGPSGVWLGLTNRYLGLVFEINGLTHYGWARLNVTDGRSGPIVTLTGYAYETTPGQAIKSGEEYGP